MADVLLQKRTPTVLWAQRRDRLFLTIEVPCAGQAPKVSLKDDPGTLSFTGHVVGASPEEAVEYALELAFLHPVNAKDSKISVGPREVVVMVMKTEEHSGSHWPRLLKAPGKVPHVKTDFNKWVDEDEEDEMDRDNAFDLSKLENMSNYEDDAFLDGPDSDDEDDLPDLEKV